MTLENHRANGTTTGRRGRTGDVGSRAAGRLGCSAESAWLPSRKDSPQRREQLTQIQSVGGRLFSQRQPARHRPRVLQYPQTCLGENTPRLRKARHIEIDRRERGYMNSDAVVAQIRQPDDGKV
jgi:hypothetical protein